MLASPHLISGSWEVRRTPPVRYLASMFGNRLTTSSNCSRTYHEHGSRSSDPRGARAENGQGSAAGNVRKSEHDVASRKCYQRQTETLRDAAMQIRRGIPGQAAPATGGTCRARPIRVQRVHSRQFTGIYATSLRPARGGIK